MARPYLKSTPNLQVITMSGKHVKKKRSSGKSAALAFALALLTIAVVALAVWRSSGSADTPPAEETPAAATPAPEQTEATPAPSAAPSVEVELEPVTAINLGYGLEISDVGSYIGAYMEDGSDEFVSGVMMLIVRNNGETDLQFANIEVAYTDFTASFQVTNLPAGQAVVLLELNRQPLPEGEPLSAVAQNVVLFDEPMSLREDILALSGSDGSITVKNISDADISGDIYVYYKNSAADLLYGGITYRAKVEGGLAAGEERSIVAGHYDPDNSLLTLVTCGG